MEPFRYHVFICDQHKAEGVPSCPGRGSAATIEALRREIHARGLDDEVQITTCGSLGLCEHGPNLVVYPQGTWYSGVTAADVPELVQSHFQKDIPLERLVRSDPAEVRAEVLANRARFRAAMRAKEGSLPDEWNDRIRAFQESRVILSALELDLFSALGEGARAPEAAAKIGSDTRATEMLLNALAALGLVEKSEGVFRNGPVATRFLTSNSPDGARMALLHIAHLWVTWSTLTDCVRAGTSAGVSGTGERDADWTEAFIAAMHRNASERAGAVVRAVGAEDVRRMLDVGGGSGAYSIAFAQANPALDADILDLPAVGAIARRHIEAAGVADRVRVRAGDLRSDRLGEGYDLVFVSAICHMLSEAENRDLVARAAAALAPGGRIVIQDFILEPDKTAPRSAAMFSLNMLVGTRAGASYSEPEYAAWLAEAGFTAIRRVRLPGPAQLMIATRS
jgi:(2Fe-2S) ferredoxin/predicted O-methyltransferase YrrM